MEKTKSEDGFWLFGYGSLMWKPPPHFDDQVPGTIKGYVRRFWQASEDHRGTPERPGRVVTLISHEDYAPLRASDVHADKTGDKVWGTAYHIPAAEARGVLAYLDVREQNGYSVQSTTFYPRDDKAEDYDPFECIVYIGLPSNPQFLGPQEPQALAERIMSCSGPSGANNEYVYRLESALFDHIPGGDVDMKDVDFHVSDLAERCKAIGDYAKKETKEAESGEFSKVGSTAEMEEVEK